MHTERGEEDSHSKDLFAGSSQQDGAGFGIFTLCDEGEVFIADLLHLKQPRPRTNVFLTKLIRPACNTSAARPVCEREREKEFTSSVC